ncbi:glycosyltransferase [Mycobacterium arosiense]|uniref:Glycosyl transferase family 1 n=1 Tax=Mycobacterium arosiense ATCC BAA-1401 = DSM 45069 TaxID=1265311 RepID=A0A1W9ZNT9_MYCAI|nr:glycosyltransferase [Mycobacterium arosiense]ORA19507.1 glycosyl transferase family 1 [Mycobacterium arosiense ATCC BAA-1401 = DSM 45069]
MRVAIVSGDDVAGEDPEQLCAALGAQGHDATLCLRRASRRSAQASAEADYHRVSIPVGPRGATSPVDVLPYVGQWAATLDRIWTTEPPVVVHAYGWLGGLAAQLAARRRRIPTVQTFLGLAATSPGHAGAESERKRIEPLLSRSATWVTGESSDDVDALARLRRRRTRVSALTCGVDAERYTSTGPTAPRNGLQRILAVTPNPLSHNGIDIIIRALPKVRGAELVIVESDATNGSHNDARAVLQRLASELGVADRVRFAGRVPDDELPMLIRSADLAACTPRQPPRATTVLQGMSCGVAVVAASVGVLADVVLDEITGLVVAPENPAALAAAARRLLGHRFQSESMGSAGRSRAASRFAWQRIALDALNIYASLGSPDRTPAGAPSTVR